MTGEITPPCGVPVTGRRSCPSSIPPARSIARRSFRTGWSQTRSSPPCINLSCGIAEKTVRDVRLHHPPAAPPALIDKHLQGVVRRPPRAEPETRRQEVRLENPLAHHVQRS